MTKDIKNKTCSVGTPLKFSSEGSIGLPISSYGGYSTKGFKYLPYSSDAFKGNSTNNLYPQLIAQMAYDSPTNSAAIGRKAMMIKGSGFNLDLLPKGLKTVFDNLNKYDETINDILELISVDYAMFSGFALKIIWLNKGTIGSIEHIPFTDVRCGEPNEEQEVDYYVVSNNWDRTLNEKYSYTYSIPKFNPKIFGKDSIEKIDGILTPNDEQINNAEQLIYFYNRKPAAKNGMQFYPVPDYIGGFDAISTEIQIGISNKSLIDNGFGGKYMVTFPFEPQSQKEREEIDTKLKQNFSGASNNGGVITLFASDPLALPRVDKLEPIDANTYVELEKNVKQSIITSHQIPAILLEITLSGGFNNRAEELVTAFKLYQKTNIFSYQQKIVRVFKTISEYLGFKDVDLEIIPFSLEDESTNSTQGGSNVNTN